MTDPTTTSVLADVAAWVIAALVLGFGAYQARRALMPLSDWSLHGKVDAGAYRAVDGVVVLGLAWLMWRGLRSQSDVV